MSNNTKNSNPKDGIGATKLPLSLVPKTALAVASLAHLDGALKYGKWNWRKTGVRASVYLDACARHLANWENGEEVATDGVHHLGHAIACLNILIDAQACGKLNDDRPPSMPIGEYFAELTGWVQKLLERHKDRNPHHCTIADTTEEVPEEENVAIPKSFPELGGEIYLTCGHPMESSIQGNLCGALLMRTHIDGQLSFLCARGHVTVEQTVSSSQVL